jgi:hypothetical protein
VDYLHWTQEVPGSSPGYATMKLIRETKYIDGVMKVYEKVLGIVTEHVFIFEYFQAIGNRADGELAQPGRASSC